MFRKIFITLAISFFTFAPALVEATTAIDPPDLIGGSLLPGTSDDVKEEVEKETEKDGTTLLIAAEQELQWLQTTFLNNVINQLIGWTAALAVVFLVIGGYQYLTAVGNDEQIKSAHKTITWSLAGLLLAMLAFAIVQILVNIDFNAPASTPAANLLAADVAEDVKKILPFAEDGWEGDAAIKNLPRGDFKTEFLPVVVRFLIYGMAFVAFLVFFVAGVWLVVGWGDEESVKKAKNAIVWGVVGLAFAAASYALVKGLLDVELNWTS